MAGTGVAARQGILIKDAEALEIAHSVTVVAFDKTGTLTEGKPSLVSIEPVQGGSVEEVLRIAGALQKTSEHPLAHAVLEKVRGNSTLAYRRSVMPKPCPGEAFKLGWMGS